MPYDPNDGRYAVPVLAARIECAADHPTGNCSHPRRLRLWCEGQEWQAAEIVACLQRLTVRPQKTKDNTGEITVPLTWAVVTQLARLMTEKDYIWRPDPYLNLWIKDEFTRRFTEFSGDSSDLKFDASAMTRTPMPHQLAGAFVGALNHRFFFGDEAGVGKTTTALLTLAELEAQGKDPFPAFVVAPASVVDQWGEELGECFPDWPYAVYRGPRRRNLSTQYKIYLMSWDVLRADMKHENNELPALLKFAVPRTLILDEAHALCSKSKQSTAAKQLARVTEFAFPMSGTPITRDVGGFWTALNILDIRSFPDEDRYKDLYTDRYRGDYSDHIDGLSPERREEFFLVIQGSMRRVAKQDVFADLPPKTYSTRLVELPHVYKLAYKEMEEDMIAHLPDGNEPLEVMSTLAQLTRLVQLASSACDVEIEMVLDEREDSPTFGMEIPKTHVTMKEPSWKVDELMRIMDDMQGSPLITFAPSTQLMKLAGARAEREGYRVGYIIGGQSASQRTTTRKAFQAGELDLLCCNTAAGGVGLNLTAASTTAFLGRDWSYWRGSQAEDRTHRKGQTAEKVHIIDVVAANTVESRIRIAMKQKAAQLSELVRDPRIVREFLGGE